MLSTRSTLKAPRKNVPERQHRHAATSASPPVKENEPHHYGLDQKALHLDGCRRTRRTGDFASRARDHRHVWGSAPGRDRCPCWSCIASVRSSMVRTDPEDKVLSHTGLVAPSTGSHMIDSKLVTAPNAPHPESVSSRKCYQSLEGSVIGYSSRGRTKHNVR
jgi:hypothetical protein